MNKETMHLIALLFSTAITSRPEAYPADWANEHDAIPDLALGTGNNWWLRINETGGLYIQSRNHELSEYTSTIAEKMLRVSEKLLELGIAVQIPWPSRDISRAFYAWEEKTRRIEERVRQEIDAERAELAQFRAAAKQQAN